tara:strand:- start:282 stop:527 length:246 start_codon:yes stop_codon:yes gene_type:complete
MKKLIILFGIFFISFQGIAENNKIIITFKEMSEFQACYAFMVGSHSIEQKSMLSDWIKIKDFNCSKYAEVIYRAKIFGAIK